MRMMLALCTLLIATCQPVYADTTGNLGLTLVNKDITFRGKFKHTEENGKWQSNYLASNIYQTTGGAETINRAFFQFKENYALNDKGYLIGVAQVDYDKFRTQYDMRAVTGLGYGYKLLRTDNWKASNEVSFAYLKSDTNELIIRNSLWVQYKLSTNLSLVNKFLVESGNNPYIRNSTDLMYKLTEKVSLGVGNTYTDNIESKNIFTINLAIKFK